VVHARGESSATPTTPTTRSRDTASVTPRVWSGGWARDALQMASGKIHFGDTNTTEGNALREELRKGIFTANNKWSKRFALGSPLSHLVVWNYLYPNRPI
jgi:hypothetical protein